MFNNKSLEEKIIKLQEENGKLKKIINTQDKIIKNYSRKKQEYENLIFKRAISFKQYQNKIKSQSYQEQDNEEDEEL